MLLRAALLASAFSALISAGQTAATPAFSGRVFPNQDKSLTQLTQQALDKQVRAVVTGKQQGEAPNPARMPFRRFVLPSKRARPFGGKWQIAQAFPPIAVKAGPVFCAIPLLETRVPTTTDPMAKPAGRTNFDPIGETVSRPRVQKLALKYQIY